MKNVSFKRKKESSTIDVRQLPIVKGFQLSRELKALDVLHAYGTLGFQASNVAKAAELIREMQSEGCAIFLSFTSNMVSSGLREIFAQVVKEKLVAAIITSTGSIEEDFMKSRDTFYVGDFEADDAEVKENKLNRIGNIFVPDEQYCDLEDFNMRFLEKLYQKNNVIAPSEYIFELGKEIKDENSILYWASKNNIPIFCPGFVDGAIGDHIYFFNQNKKEKLVIDTAKDVTKFYDLILQPEKIAGIVLGGGIAKHHLIGAAILRDGLDYAVYVSTGTQYDGSLSGALPKEAVSWNKLKDKRKSVHVEADVTLVFPLLALSMMENKKEVR